jgi:hypothetical protein
MRLFLIAAILLLATNAQGGEIRYAPPEAMGIPPADMTPEISGIALSRKNEDVIGVHNDSGDRPKVYALSVRTGELLSIAELPGASSKDWEDMAIGPGPDKRFDYLYLADFGNNARKKKQFWIHRTPEPLVASRSEFKAAEAVAKSVETFTFTYPDPDSAVFDAETLLVDPENGEITVVTKDQNENNGISFVFRSDGPLSPIGVNRLVQVGSIDFGRGIRNRATGGDVSADGRWVIERTYLHARLYSREPGQRVSEAILGPYTKIDLAPEPQGEAIAFEAPRRSLDSKDENPPAFYSASELGPKIVNPNQIMRPISRYQPLNTEK